MQKEESIKEQHPGKDPGNLPFILMAALTVGFVLFLFSHPAAWLYLLNLSYFGIPFLDSYALLAASEAHMMGLNVFEPNPLDIFGRPHSYSRWWLLMGDLGLTREHIYVMGIIVNSLFLTSVLIVLRPRCWTDASVGVLAICSSAVLLGVERANNDLIIFALLSTVPILLNWRMRLGIPAAWLVLFLATGLKYFPAMGYIVFIKKLKDIQVLWWVIFSALAATSAYIFYYLSDINLVRNILVDMTPLSNAATIGSWLFFYRIGLSMEFSQWLVWPCLAAILVGGFILATKYKLTLPQIDSRRESFFLMGAGIMVFSFFVTISYDYRSVFLLFTLPYLLKLTRSPEASVSLRRAIWIVLLLVMALLWSEGVHNTYIINLKSLKIVDGVIDYSKFFIFKNSLVWVVITSLIFISFLMLKPEVIRLWPELLELLKIRRTLENN